LDENRKDGPGKAEGKIGSSPRAGNLAMIGRHGAKIGGRTPSFARRMKWHRGKLWPKNGWRKIGRNDLLSVSSRAIADFKKDLWETLSDGAEGRF